MRDEMAASPLRVLVVCTGNICRSPLAEVFLRARLSVPGVRVSSAGTHALVGHEMTEPAQRIALDHGADPHATSAHRAQLLVETMVASSDLVLTMTRAQRSHTVQLVPSALRRTFTVREFARLAQTLPDGELSATASADDTAGARLRQLARTITEQRGIHHGAPEDDDVIDPYRQPFSVYETSAAQLIPALTQVTRVVGIAAGRGHRIG